MPKVTLALFMLACAGPASAHGSERHEAGYGWTFDPVIVVPLLIALLVYLVGLWRLARRSRSGFARLAPRIVSYLSGWLILAGSLVSPLHEMGEHLFTFHMIEHELVMAVAAPLMVLGRPIGLFLWGLPQPARQSMRHILHSRAVTALWFWLTSATVATLLHGAAIWIWHAPPLFDLTVSTLFAHRLQHLSFFVTAVFFWWSMLWSSSRGRAAWDLFLTMMHTGALGALIALSPRVLYVAQTRMAGDWGLTPLEDQQLAGFVMWAPGGLIYAGAALALLSLWIARSGKGGLDGPVRAY